MNFFDKQKIKAVIFDLDGIIIDSEPWQKIAFERTLKPYGIKLTNKEFARFIGIRTYENFVYLKSKYNLPLSAKELTKIKNQYYEEILKKQAHPREGLIELLNYLQPQYVLSVASGSIKKDVMGTLRLLNIEKYFKLILTGDDIKNGKPDPEIFIKTAQRLNLFPRQCVAIEDSENGVKSAKRAGMYVIAAPTSSTKYHNFKDADIIIKNLAEIKNLL